MFCKYCGQSIPDDSLYCEGCGQHIKKNQAASDYECTPSAPITQAIQANVKDTLIILPRKVKFVLSFIIILVVALCILCGWQHYQLNKISSNYANMEGLYLSTEAKLTKTQEDLDSLRKENRTLQASFDNEHRDLVTSHAKLNFLEFLVAYTTPTGSKYHTIDCFHLKESDPNLMGIYLFDEVQRLGYTPCSDCRTPAGTPKWSLTEEEYEEFKRITQ